MQISAISGAGIHWNASVYELRFKLMSGNPAERHIIRSISDAAADLRLLRTALSDVSLSSAALTALVLSEPMEVAA